MKTNKWITPKGANIELTTEHVTAEIGNSDGWEVTRKVDRIQINEFKVDGEECEAILYEYKGMKTIKYGEAKIKGKIHPMLILLPDEAYEEVWGEYDRRQKARAEASVKADIEYRKHYNMVRDAMKEY